MWKKIGFVRRTGWVKEKHTAAQYNLLRFGMTPRNTVPEN